jgi:hypothetical protein
MRDRKMHLLAYVKTGPTAQLAGAWRHPAADLDDILKPERYEHMARVLEVAGSTDVSLPIRWVCPTSTRIATTPT